MPATMSAASAKSMPAFTPHQQPSFASPQGDCRRATPRRALSDRHHRPSAATGIGVVSVSVSAEEMAGINDRQTDRGRENPVPAHRRGWMKHATFRDPDAGTGEPASPSTPPPEIGRNVVLRGRTKIGAAARSRRRLHSQRHRGGCRRRALPYTVATQSIVGPGAKVGPFAHLRPGTKLGPDVHVGNYVETKKTRLGRGSKANHLTYLGDTIVGEGVNVARAPLPATITAMRSARPSSRTAPSLDQTRNWSRRCAWASARWCRRRHHHEDIRDGALAITRVPLKQIDGYADRVGNAMPTKPRPKAD